MPKIRLILIALFGMFLLGCATNGNRNPASPGKKAGIRCGKGATVVHAECFEAQEKIQQARRKARRKSSDQDSWCGTACLSGRQKAKLEGKSGLVGEWIGENWYERGTDSFRLRSMSGDSSFETAWATNTSYALILNNWGLGQTIEESYELYPDDTVVTTKSQYLDFSYTFNLSDTTGDSLTLTIGAGAPRGEIEVTTSTNTFSSTTVSGAGYFAVLGIELWIFELLAGYRVSNIKYSGLGSTDSSVLDLEGSYSMSGSQTMYGLGLSF